jgi:DNA segregation ATPase FtsK/SpoIIIE, S-DNA-T family
VLTYLLLAVVAAAALLARRPLTHLVRFALAAPAARRHFAAMAWWSCRHRWLMRNCQLAYLDQHRRRVSMLPTPPGSTAVTVSPLPSGKLRFPRGRYRLDPYGWSCTVRTVPRVTRAEFAAAAQTIADTWSCYRVSVTQPRPGRVTIRGLRRDPLIEAYPMADAPREVFSGDPAANAWRVYLGRDGWGEHRRVPLAGIPGIIVGGLPGCGKTSLITSWLLQLLPSPAVCLGLVADGKAGGDFDHFAHLGRVVGDDLNVAAEALTAELEEMRRRLAEWPAATGIRNQWKAGPTPARPLRLVVVDEAHSYLDLESVKGDRSAEAAVRQCRHALTQLVKKGRSVMMCTLILTQKTTGDAVPTALRDCAPLAVSFATKTTEAAVACLGDDIRQWPDASPTLLQGSEYIGVAVASLRSPSGPFVMLRCPEVPEDQAAAMAAAIAAPVPVLHAARPADPPAEVVA